MAIPRTRSRVGDLQYPQTVYLGTAKLWKFVDNAWVLQTVTPKTYVVSSARKYSYLETTSDELHAGPPWKEGGPFDCFKMSDYSLAPIPVDNIPHYAGVYKYTYEGGFLPTWAAPSGHRCVDGVNLDAVKSSLGSVSGYGAEAFNKFAPLKPRVDLAQFLAEFREIPRMIKSSAEFFHKEWTSLGGGKYRSSGKTAANEWLNSQFGWVPFLGTIKDTYETTKKLSNVLAYLREHNGQWDKRGGAVAETVSQSLVYASDGAYMAPSLSSVYPKSRLRVYKYNEQNVWYTAKYKYYLPQLEEMDFPPGLIAHIYGLDITPSLIWELTPWSWLADWFTNVGDLLEASDNGKYGETVTTQAYLMGTTRIRYNIQAKFHDLGYAERNYVLERKERIEASSPFGFDVQFNDLSPWQISILGALGIGKML